MKILQIVKVLSSSMVIGQDVMGREYRLQTDKSLVKGQNVAVKNGVIVGVVRGATQKIYEV